MKRIITVLSGLLVLPAFAEVAPVYYDEIVEYTDEMIDAADEAEEQAQVEATANKNVAQRSNINRSTSRAISAAATTNAKRANTSSRAIASRGTTARTTTSRTAKTSSVVARPASARSTTNVVSRSSRNNKSIKPVTARIGTSNRIVTGAFKTTTNSSSDGYSGYIDDTTATFTPSNVSVPVASSARAASTRRLSTARLSTTAAVVDTTPVITEEAVSSTTTNLTAIAELTDYCKAQYAACMDNYCNVLDDNQGRCSCSKNLKNYKLTEDALADATEQYQEAIQKIKYIGLTAKQIDTLFTATEAEKQMDSNGNKDTTTIRKSLDQIKERLLIDAQSGKATSSYQGTSVSMDASGLFNFDEASGGLDLSGFMSTYTTTNTASVSNQRGEQLYKTAVSRCKTAVLNSCEAQGIDPNIITNSYDLEIDKQCIAYERKLNDANAEMKTNARNAATILQQARLVLAQNKNAYDVRGCVAAIDACMQDEYVCGSDYSLCLDPTGKYLSDGEIVKGGTPGVSGGTVANTTLLGTTVSTGEGDSQTSTTIDPSNWTTKGMYNLYSAWNYSTSAIDATVGASNTLNAWGAGAKENLSGYIDAAMNTWKTNYTSTAATGDMATYLLRKLGYIESNNGNKVHGMCASVFNQCQDYTFKGNSYNPDNEVVRQYLASALTKIKLQQDTILADYAEDCRSDVSSCLSTNGYDENNTNTTASKTAVNACRADIVTCMSVGGFTPKDNTSLTLSAMSDWVASMLKVCPTNYYLVDDITNETKATAECLPCPEVEELKSDGSSYADNNANPAKPAKYILMISAGGQATSCTCPTGYQLKEVTESNTKVKKCQALGS